MTARDPQLRVIETTQSLIHGPHNEYRDPQGKVAYVAVGARQWEDLKEAYAGWLLSKRRESLPDTHISPKGCT